MKTVYNVGTNTIDASLQRAAILQTAVRAFARVLAPLRAFSTSFFNVPLQGNAKIEIPYFALDATVSSDFSTSYVAGDTTTSKKEITINKRKYQGVSFTSSELRRQPALNLTQLITLKAEKLAADVLDDIWSLIDAATFGTAAWSGAASSFDTDAVAEIKLACDQANWPKNGRSLILESAHDQYLTRDSRVSTAFSYGSPEGIKEGHVTRILGFDYYDVPNLPANSENLCGIVCAPSALLIAFSPIQPTDEVGRLITYEVAIDPTTGIALEYRRWGTPSSDKTEEYIECNYGRVAGNVAALKRITSA